MANEPGHGTPDALREFLGEMARLAALQAELCAKFSDIGDDVGASYALRRATAYLRAATETMQQLGEEREP